MWIFFHGYCIIVYSTMFTVRLHWILTVLLQLLSPVYCLCCLYMLSFSQCDIFPQLLHNWLYNNVYSISLAYTYSTIYNYTTQYTNCAVYIYFPFHNVNIFPRLLYNCLFHYVYSEASLDTYSTVYNYSPQYTVCAVYICCPFHNVIFFLNYCTIDSTTMSTAYPQHIHTVLLQLHYPVYWLCCLYMLPLHNVTFFHNDCTIHSTTMFTAYSQHIHTVLFTITLPSILTVQFTYAILLTMWYFSTMTAQFTLQQCLQHILNIYIRYCLQLHYPVYCLCYYICYTFHNMIFFSQLLHNWLYNNVYSISATYTYSTVYNYSPQYTGFAVYICFLNTIWHFFTITAQLNLQQCLQHILNIYMRYCLQLHYPVYWLCCIYMLPLHNVTFFYNYCTIDSTTMSTAYP